MTTLKFIAVATATIFLSTGILSAGAANKTTAKTQYTKKTYNKSQKRQTTAVQTKEFKVPGIQAWSEARKNGFEFYPHKTNGLKDGVGEKGLSICIDHRPVFLLAQMVGGVNMILHQCKENGIAPHSSHTFFYLFNGKKLNQQWKIKDMKFTGSYSWVGNKKYQKNTTNIATKIKLNNSAQQKKATKAQLKEIVLIGPKNGRWQDAFDVM